MIFNIDIFNMKTHRLYLSSTYKVEFQARNVDFGCLDMGLKFQITGKGSTGQKSSRNFMRSRPEVSLSYEIMQRTW